MISTRIRGVSPDKTDCLAKQSWCPIILPTASLLQNRTKVFNTRTKVTAGQSWPGCFLFAPPKVGRGYNIGGDSVDETVSLAGRPTLLETIVPTAAPNNPNETTKTSLAAPSALPINAVEVQSC